LLFFGVYFFILELLSTDTKFFLEFNALGPYTFFFYTSFFNGLALLLYGYMNKGKIDMKKAKTVIPYMVAAEIIYLVAWIGLTYGFAYGDSAIVTAVSSLFPAITILLALIFYKEKLVVNQYLGILLILAGLFMISI
jgi:drug/metabolite transporter (DMT)-like permease